MSLSFFQGNVRPAMQSNRWLNYANHECHRAKLTKIDTAHIRLQTLQKSYCKETSFSSFIAVTNVLSPTNANLAHHIPFSFSISFISKSTQCSTSAISEEDKCDDRSRTYMREAIKGYSGEVFDLFCGNDLLWDSNHCKKVTKNLPVDSKNKKPLSVLPIVLEMMERF